MLRVGLRLRAGAYSWRALSSAARAANATQFTFGIDRGGTFTDVYAEWKGVADNPAYAATQSTVIKLLSEDPANYPDAPREGIRRVLASVRGEELPPEAPVPSTHIAEIRMGTTVATNALLERKGEPMALAITHGFRDLLAIGNQARPDIFDLTIKRPELLYQQVVEIPERVRVVTRLEEAREAAGAGAAIVPPPHVHAVEGITGETVHVLEPLDVDATRAALARVREQGITSLAVVCMHSYAFPDHEAQIGAIAKDLGFTHISLSSDLMPRTRIVPRGYTAAVDAYLSPIVARYIDSFCAGFDARLLSDVNVQFMNSDGVLSPVDEFSGFRAILSGPAGGVVGYAETAFDGETPVIGYDMGGTSTDVSRYDGKHAYVYESETAGVTTQAPQLDITTVAAGGGSKLMWSSNMFKVGPESVGAHPGPVCYRKGGSLAVTDANLYLGRLDPASFPSIFGPHENEPLDSDATARAFSNLADTVNADLVREAQSTGSPAESQDADAIAAGFLAVANESMCRPIRAITEAKGYASSDHVLAVFGGAGGQHACAIASSLDMSRIVIHRFSGVLSAYGMALAPTADEAQAPAAVPLDELTANDLVARFDAVARVPRQALAARGFADNAITQECYLNLRFEGADTSLMVEASQLTPQSFKDAFLKQYQQEYGFVVKGRPILVDDVRVRAIGTSPTASAAAASPVHTTRASAASTNAPLPPPKSTMLTYFTQTGGRVDTPVYDLHTLPEGSIVSGPALIIDATATVVVEPGWDAVPGPGGDLVLEKAATAPAAAAAAAAETRQASPADAAPVSALDLSIYANRFMSIAEQMGVTLQRTSISTNIKDRLDFSCALFGPDGGLVANAPHVPVHLGSMQEAVRYQIDLLGDSWREGDVVVSNHPNAGGSHLPDITVMTPVFVDGSASPAFYVASRGHHADIGGITPGSMPPFSKRLAEEGIAIESFKIVDGGEFQDAALRELLTSVSAQDAADGISATRALADNITDLEAQIAANHKGITLMSELIGSASLDKVTQAMHGIQAKAALAVSNMLRSLAASHGVHAGDPPLVLHAKDRMDDGSPIELAISIDPTHGTASFDFTRTSPQALGNTNAPRAITLSAIIYVLRSLVHEDIPLNQGCLTPIDVSIPFGSMLDPRPGAAVVAGNVLVSQRVTDVVLQAFGAAACSQGDMNNFTFGDDAATSGVGPDFAFGYYETICGGAGAGPSWDGASGVHTHMTNTRITDVEILERRYPTLVKEFSLRPGSGGDGAHRGGDGVIRTVQFLKRIAVSILSERRSLAPPGLAGGAPGARGLNFLRKAGDGGLVALGGKASFICEPGDEIEIHTPGGGGYGPSQAS